MSAHDWFYAQGGQQMGPISAVELKQLVDAGKVRPDDLVWQEGMKQWAAAKTVKGLFPKGAPAAAAPPIATPPMATPPTAQQPAAAPSGVAPIPLTAAAAAPIAAPAAAPIDFAPKPAEAVFEGSTAMFARQREGGNGHLFDAMLDWARSAFPGSFLDATTALFTLCGHFGLYLAMAMSLLLGVVLSVRTSSSMAILTALGAVLVMLVLQYAARRLIGVLERLIRNSPSQLSSTAILDCIALLSGFAGAAALVLFSVTAVQNGNYGVVVAGLAVFVLCQCLALLAINPEVLQIAIVPETGAGEEAIGVFSFLVKASARLASVAYGVGAAMGMFILLQSALGIVRDEPPYITLARASDGVLVLTVYSLMPILAYFSFLLYHLLVDVLRAILSLPAKFDKLIEKSR